MNVGYTLGLGWTFWEQFGVEGLRIERCGERFDPIFV